MSREYEQSTAGERELACLSSVMKKKTPYLDLREGHEEGRLLKKRRRAVRMPRICSPALEEYIQGFKRRRRRNCTLWTQ